MGNAAHAATLHREAMVVDTHSDTILELWLHPEREFSVRDDESFDMDLPRTIEGGVNVQMMAITNGDSPASVGQKRPEREAVPLTIAKGQYVNGVSAALDCIDLVYREVERSPDKLAVVTTAEEMRRAKDAGQVGILMSTEGRLPTGSTPGTVRMLYRLGVRCIAVSGYEHRASATEGGDLDPFAIELIREMDRLGILIDVSHLLEKGFWQVVDAGEGIFVDTHANAYGLCAHPRNLKDDQLKALAERRGVIGVMCYNPHVHPTDPTLSRMLDHIDYIADRIGVEYVGLGMDFDGMGGARQKAVLNDITEMPKITEGLVERGYSDDDVRKILGENYMRVFADVLR